MRGLFKLQGIPVMLSIGKILGIGMATAGNQSAVASFVKQILWEGTRLIALAIMIGITGAALLVGLFFGAYLCFRYFGLDPLAAAGIVGAAALLAMGVLAFSMASCLQRFRSISLDAPRPALSVAEAIEDPGILLDHARSVAGAFMKGLRNSEGRNGRRRERQREKA